MFCSDGEADVTVRRRESTNRGKLRHAFSELLPNEDPRRRSQTMTEAKEYAYNRLQKELDNAQLVSRAKKYTYLNVVLLLKCHMPVVLIYFFLF